MAQIANQFLLWINCIFLPKFANTRLGHFDWTWCFPIISFRLFLYKAYLFHFMLNFISCFLFVLVFFVKWGLLLSPPPFFFFFMGKKTGLSKGTLLINGRTEFKTLLFLLLLLLLLWCSAMLMLKREDT